MNWPREATPGVVMKDVPYYNIFFENGKLGLRGNMQIGDEMIKPEGKKSSHLLKSSLLGLFSTRLIFVDTEEFLIIFLAQFQ